MDALRRKAMRRYSKDELVFMVDRGEQAQYERDALADRLATLTTAGIVVGEDGAVRWHGLTGTEIERMKEEVRRIEVALDLDYYSALQRTCRTNNTPIRLNKLSLSPTRFNDLMHNIVLDALAAAAGRGADGEAT